MTCHGNLLRYVVAACHGNLLRYVVAECHGNLLRYVVAEGGSKCPVLISNLHVEGDVFLLAFNDVPTFVQYLIILQTPI